MEVEFRSKIKETVLRKLSNKLFDRVIFGIELTFLGSRHKLFPGVMALLNNFIGVVLVHESFIQAESVWWFSIGDFVSTVPFTNRVKHTGHFIFNIINIIEEWSPFIFSINCNNLPVTFTFIDHTKNSKHLHGADSTGLDETCSNLDNIYRIIVTPSTFSIRVDVGGIFPSLWETSVVEINISLLELTQDTLLFILFNRIADLIGGNFVFLS
mmetsp:Transcript_8539/g.13088  ORF Transcript_8539/g.13088 Transcript_8539/m.13088 type:complete len:212 (+) Transcript_8539:293-928(+)